MDTVSTELLTTRPLQGGNSEILILEKQQLMHLLPHAGDALVLDQVEIDFLNKEATGHFHVGGPNAHVLQGHFGIMPGHWQYEVANLTCATLALSLLKKRNWTKLRSGVRLVGASGLRYRSEAKPGESLFCNVTLFKEKGPFFFFKASVRKAGTREETLTIDRIVGTSVPL